eukprot:SAG22_NODE_617_length_8527_cov_70.297342_6_plen_301_part_00
MADRYRFQDPTGISDTHDPAYESRAAFTGLEDLGLTRDSGVYGWPWTRESGVPWQLEAERALQVASEGRARPSVGRCMSRGATSPNAHLRLSGLASALRQPAAEERPAGPPTSTITSTISAAAMAAAPDGIVDPHFHFLDPENNPAQHATLLKAHPDLAGYLPDAYKSDFASLNVAKSVHMEVRCTPQILRSTLPSLPTFDYSCTDPRLPLDTPPPAQVIPDDFVYEVKWVSELAATKAPWVKAIVAAADPASPEFVATLDAAKAAAPDMLRGIRWILNYDGELQVRASAGPAAWRAPYE